VKAERTKWAWLSAIAVAVLLIATVILIRLGQQPPAHALYFAANYDAWWIRPLFSITPLPNGYRVESQQFDCRTTAADTKTKRQPFTTAVKAEFRCDEHLLELREKGDTPILTSTGFTDLTAPFVVGSGYPVSAQRDEAPRFVYRAPGVAARHLIAFPSAECGGSPAADAALCAENGGATGSMLLYPVNGDATRLQHGERITVANNDVLWLGYVPFRVTSDDGKITLRVVLTEDRKSWRTMGGERLWQGLELPSWNLTARDPAVPSGTNVFYPEAARFSKGHLTAERYEPEQEEQLQLLVDHELLCLESASGALNDARVVWRPPHDPGCVDYGLTTPVRTRRMPPPDTVLRTYQQVQSEDRFGELMTQSTANLRDRVWELDPTSNLFVFDFGFTATPPGPDGRSDLERVPTALLGVRPRITTTRLRKPEATFRRPIAFRASSTSPALDLEAAGPRRLLLMLSNPVGPSGTSAPMHVCLSPAGGTLQDPAPGSIALGNVALQGDGVWWAAAGSAAGNDCVELIRRAADVTARSLGGVAASRHPRDGSAEVAIGATATPLIDGDSVGIGTMRFRYTAANDLAAFSLRGGGRVYPFGADGVTLLGIGSVSNGVEGAMALEMRTELYRDAQRRRRAGQAEEPLRLTIDGDMQRLVSRELNEAFRENAPAAALRGLRAAAVVLDADTGGVLAVANAPRFDPWDTTNPTDSELLLSAMRGQVTDDDTFRSRIQNWAFLRHLAVGSTMKVATSIAMQREGIRLSDQDDASGEGCHHLLTIRLAGGRRVDDFKCTHDNPVLANGAPSPAHWLPAFYGSCNVYFGGAAAMLVPELGTSIFSAGPTATIPASFDPAALRPLDLEPVNRSGGNGFFETLLLLGYRFDFHDARNAPPQQVTRYRQLQYPTIREPWLAGLEVENAFAYPTVPAPERFTNTFRGGEPQLNVPGLEIDGKAEYKPQWKSQDWMPHYMALGWGQIMEGSALSIAVSGIPALNSLGQIRTPQIFASRVAPLDPRRPALLNNEQQLVLQKGFKEVIANAAGTAHAALLDTRNAAERMGYQIGGKTGTIQLEKPPTQTGHADVASRARWWGCGVRGFAFDDGDWQKLLSIVSGTKAAAIADAYPTLPPRGFAAQAAECDGLNPGMPRVAGALPNGVADAWRELQSLEWRAVPDRENNSSAFLAAIWPNPVQPPANPAAAPPRTGNRRLILGITFDLNSAGSKAATRRIARELVRLMAARGE
jgi:cell division protein FtsI/penicillin-binding protein 2